jgi:hypothetical protein
MSFIRIKSVKKNGRTYRYRYRQTSVREGKRVRSIMEYLGPAEPRGLRAAERHAKKVDAYQKATFGETGEERAQREKASHFDQAEFLKDTQEAPEADKQAPE